MSRQSYALYKDAGSGKKYKMFPTLEWFDKKTELLVGERIIKNIPFVDLKKFLIDEAKTGLEEPFIGGIDVNDKVKKFLKKYCSYTIDFSLYDYQLSFDNPEWIED